MTILVMRFFIFGSMPTPSGFAISLDSLKFLLGSCPRAGIRKAAERMSRRTKLNGRGTVPHACRIFLYYHIYYMRLLSITPKG